MPRSWELVAYKKNPHNGQLVLSNRRGETMQAHWLRVRKKPSLPHRLADLVQHNLAADSPLDDAEVRRHFSQRHGWLICASFQPQLPLFAARYILETKTLVILNFPPHPDDPEHRHAERVLEAYDTNSAELCRWAAFGLSFALPRKLRLLELDALPTHQRFRFENRAGESVTLQRFGMLPELLAESDMATYFAKLKGGGTMLTRTGEFTKSGGFPGVTLSYSTKGTGGYSALVSRRWTGRVDLWQRDDLQRLYAIEQHGRKSLPVAGFVATVEGQ